jgi:chromosome segregation ATPase
MTFRKKPKSVLKNMKVTEVSLVDEGDNPGADVVVIKRRLGDPVEAFEAFAESVAKLNVLASGGEGAEGVAVATDILKGMNMNIEELNEKLGQIEATVETVTKAKDEAEARVSELEATNAAQAAEIEKLKADAGKAAEEDDVIKSLPEPIRKRLEEAEAKAARAEEAINKANEQREIEASVEKAKALGLGDPQKIGEAMHRVAKGRPTAEDAATIEEAFAKAQAILKNSKLFDSIGRGNGGDADDPEQKLRQAALDIQKAKPALSYEAAYAEAMDANPALYDEVAKARRAVAN